MRSYDVRVDWNADGDYTNVGEDVTGRVAARASLTVGYGRDQVRAQGGMAPGHAEFELINTSRDYSPENTASPLVGNLLPARPVRMQVVLDSVTYSLFQGHIDDFTVKPSYSELPSVQVSCLDAVAKLRETRISTGLYQGIRTGEAIGYILDAVGWPAGLRSLDQGLTIMPFWWEQDGDAFTAVEKIVNSEGHPALVTVDPSGKFVFRDRHHRLRSNASIYTQAIWRGAAPTPFATAVAASSPLGWWRLNETSGTTAADASGNGRHGTYSNVTALNQPGLMPGDTANRSVLLVNDAIRNIQIPGTTLNPSSLTLLAVFRADSWNGNNRVVQKGNSDQQWRLLREGSEFKWDVFGKGTVTIPDLDTNVHVAMGTYNDATGIVELDIDGVLVGTATGTSGAAPSSTDLMFIGQKPGSGVPSDGLNGTVDEVVLWGTRLSPDTRRDIALAALARDAQFNPPVEYDHGWRNVINDVTVRVDQRAGGDFEPIWETQDLTIVLAGESKTITVETDEPFVGAQVPEDSVDYEVVNGTVSSITLSRQTGQSTTITITAGGGANLALSYLKLRAQRLTTQRTILIRGENTASIAKYGRRSYTAEVPWAGEHDARAIADIILAHHAERLPILTVRMAVGSDTSGEYAARSLEMLGRDLSDRVQVIEPQSGLNAPFYVEHIEHTVTQGGLAHETVFGLEKAPGVAGNVARFDTAGLGFDMGTFAEAGMDDPFTIAKFDTAGIGFDTGKFST